MGDLVAAWADAEGGHGASVAVDIGLGTSLYDAVYVPDWPYWGEIVAGTIGSGSGSLAARVSACV